MNLLFKTEDLCESDDKKELEIETEGSDMEQKVVISK